MSILDLFTRKPQATKPAPALDAAKLDRLVAYIKANHSIPAIRITTENAPSLPLTDSKFGGLPYWDRGKCCPRDSAGTPLTFLAQINFAYENLNHPLLPKTGILQFFITANDLYGLNLDAPTKQDSFRVIYHPEIDETVTEEDVLATGIIPNTGLDKNEACFPFYQEYKLRFEPDMNTVDHNSEEYDRVVADALKTLFNEEMDTDVLHYFSSEAYDYLVEKLSIWGHKIFGYPNFTQWDPRFPSPAPEGKPGIEEYDTLLLQIDSEGSELLWGDSGVANFFINHEDLKNLDFSRVLYNWDCY